MTGLAAGCLWVSKKNFLVLLLFLEVFAMAFAWKVKKGAAGLQQSL